MKHIIKGDNMIRGDNTFIDLLNHYTLYYDSKTIEDLLLTLKLNKLILLNGSEGIGKRTLVQKYIEYAFPNEKINKVSSKFTIGKTSTNKGFVLPREEALPILPRVSHEYGCELKVDKYVIGAHLNILPRIFFNTSKNESFYNFIEEKKQQGIEKLDYDLILKENIEAKYIILNAEKSYENINKADSFMDEAIKNSSVEYFIIFDNVSDENIKKILYKEYEIPSNLSIFYIGNLDNLSYLVNDVAIIQFNSMSPKYFLRESMMNIDFQNIEYLESFEKEVTTNINDINEKLHDISVLNNKKLYYILLNELNKLYDILIEDDICLSNKIINYILNYMYVSWKYENSPENFKNWTKYFDSLILQRIIPLLYYEGGISISLIENLINFCNSEYGYQRSYTHLSKLL